MEPPAFDPAVGPAVDPRSALAARAAREPETPFLFFRDARGHFTWWSWSRAAGALADEAAALDGGAAAAAAFLKAVLELPAADAGRAAALLAALGAADRRDIWLTRGDLDAPCGRALALAALGGGWAVVHEPGPAIHPTTFLWARPTIVGGAVAELEPLLGGCAAAAPRWRRAAWLEKRLRRLRAAVIDSDDDPVALAASLAAAGATARALCLPPAGW